MVSRRSRRAIFFAAREAAADDDRELCPCSILVECGRGQLDLRARAESTTSAL